MVLKGLAILLVLWASATLAEPENRHRLEFALRFLCTPVNGVNYAVASTTNLITMISKGGLIFEVLSVNSPSALWVSVLDSQPTNTTWTESGNITFGNVLYFKTLSPGNALDGPSPGDNYGAITYLIVNGSKAFAGATGIMVDTFRATANASSTFEINAWGFFWVNSQSYAANTPDATSRSSPSLFPSDLFRQHIQDSSTTQRSATVTVRQAGSRDRKVRVALSRTFAELLVDLLPPGSNVKMYVLCDEEDNDFLPREHLGDHFSASDEAVITLKLR